jgi:3-phosphoshikimate 1-carboxyvinyltransferase
LRATAISLPGDPSSAAFFAVAAAIVPDSEVPLPDVCVNPTRDGFVRILRRMGVAIEAWIRMRSCGEPRADLRVRRVRSWATSSARRGTVRGGRAADPGASPRRGASGETTIARRRGAAREGKRPPGRLWDSCVCLGVDVTVRPDGLVIRGTGGGPLGRGRVSARGDHRIAMAFAVAALRAPGGSRSRMPAPSTSRFRASSIGCRARREVEVTA